MARRLLPLLLALCGSLLFGASALAAAPEAPEVTVQPHVPAVTAVVHGVLNPGATTPVEAGSYEFLYRQSKTECKGGSSAPRPPGVALGLEAEAVSETLTGLQPHTEYTVCLLARNGKGEATLGPAVSFTTTGFGLHRLAVAAVNKDGSPDTQAGSHPYSLTTTFVLNEWGRNEQGIEVGQGEGFLKEVVAQLPPGFVGDPNATPKCKYAEFINYSKCPNDSAVGITTVYLRIPKRDEIVWRQQPVFNMEPPPGVPAEFAFLVQNTVPVFLDSSVRTGEDYGITVRSPGISQAIAVFASKVTIWGVPAEASHNSLRGKECLYTANEVEELEEEAPGITPGEAEQEDPQLYRSLGNCAANVPAIPLLTNPTSCGTPRTATLSVSAWQEPVGPPIAPASLTASLPSLTGCEKLDFSPSIGVTPDGTQGSTPTGLNVDLHVPQESTQNPVGLGEADVKDTTVALPAGVQISPSASDGLQACSDAQIGYKGANPVSGVQEFTPEKPSCPDASKIANVHIKTPLLEEELVGSVYLAAPQNFTGPLENPFGSLIAMYLVAEAPIAGVLLKLPGEVTLCEQAGEAVAGDTCAAPGQIVTTFKNTPALPFTDAKLEFFGTDRAPLTTPQLCGAYGTESVFTPWSGTPPASPTTSFQITSGPGGAACADPAPFAPTLDSGTTNIQAGAFSALDTTFSREDGQQALRSVTLHYPPGVSGLLTGVKLCAEAQANAGTCGPESEIGETIVSVGLGNDPFTVTGGKAYITEKYDGAPFGLSIVNPAKAGPFDLQEGRPVVVRAKIEINPINAALTVTTDPSGEHAIPSMIEGIPLQIKHVNVTVNRPGFTFNPTNCDAMAITGTINSAEGASAPVSIPFQVTNCAVLKFEPKFTVSTAGKTSRKQGASLNVKLNYPSDSLGKDANIAKVKVDLPKQLPSRLTTLQKACTAAQFEANPAGCPAASIVGHAIANTPLIPVPLTGPAYFVSYGGAKFPELVMVLQGYGVTLDLHGETFISKAGITSSTFHTVPDAPVGSFELTLPQGPDSALAANGNLCKSKLAMPTLFVAQNGAEIHESTKITATGCPNVKKAKAKSKKHKKAKSKAKKK
jgi:hypothetical protein